MLLVISKLNRRFHEAQKLIDGNTEGKTIAAEGKKRYKVVETSWPPQRTSGQYVSSSGEEERKVIKAGAYEEKKSGRDSSDDDFTSRDWVHQNEEQYGVRFAATKKSNSNSAAPSRSTRPLTRLKKGCSSQHSHSSSLRHPVGDSMLDTIAPVLQQCVHSDVSAPPTSATAAVAAEVSSSRSGGYVPFQNGNTAQYDDPPTSSSAICNYYDDLHVNYSDEDAAAADIAWEEEDDTLAAAGGVDYSSVAHDCDDHGGGFIIESSAVPKVEVILCNSSREQDTDKVALDSALASQVQPLHLTTAASLAPANPPDEVATGTAENSALDRAVLTASKMADWAGRAVKRALKGHLKKPTETIEVQSSSSAAIAEDECSQTAIESKLSRAESVFNGGIAYASLLADHERPPSQLATSTSAGGFAVSQQSSTTKASPGEAHQDYQHEMNSTVEISQESLETDETMLRRIANATRDTERLTDEMKEEVIHLIKSFDLPYLVAPFEAEAQCAVLEQVISPARMPWIVMMQCLFCYSWGLWME